MVLDVSGMAPEDPDVVYDVTGMPSIDDRDLMKVIRAMTSSKRYAAKELYETYAKIARDAGRTPAHPVAFGQGLRKAGLMRRSVRYEGKVVRGWML